MNEQNQTQLSKAERRHLKRERREQERQKQQRQHKVNKYLKRGGWLLVVAGLLAGLGFIIANQKTLPPSNIQGHIESNPPAHFMTEPMDLRIHKHMLEHADGSGAPGIIINYNCEDFECQSGLLDQLKALTEKFSHVYAAPFPKMSAMLVITRLNRQEILEEFDEEKITSFIEK